ncbi:hypothetical protein CHARACLAT_016533 [Characodon lateralis]|uniref:Uncharacterized protein n=1 Tax=Characodon lateralis TaxID=208331 RepID=A0ABU7F635_9TELE|nr:hypothetical protein [Characodon lateralis]
MAENKTNYQKLFCLSSCNKESEGITDSPKRCQEAVSFLLPSGMNMKELLPCLVAACVSHTAPPKRLECTQTIPPCNQVARPSSRLRHTTQCPLDLLHSCSLKRFT